MNFDIAFDRLIGHEGRFTDDPDDRGNWTSGQIGVGQLKGTKFGISAMSYPDLDIKNLTVADAKLLYRQDFWDRVLGGQLHNAVVYQLFDAAVNHGIGNAIRILQRALDIAEDGAMGPLTHAAIRRTETNDLLILFNAKRIRFYTKLSTFKKYGGGWSNRVATNLEYAADDYTAPWHEHLEVA